MAACIIPRCSFLKICLTHLDRAPSHLALLVVCRQPQQKSGRKQPETQTQTLSLMGMLWFRDRGREERGNSSCLVSIGWCCFLQDGKTSMVDCGVKHRLCAMEINLSLLVFPMSRAGTKPQHASVSWSDNDPELWACCWIYGVCVCV